MLEDPIVIFSTASSQAEARIIAETLVEENLAACVNVNSGIQSFYKWQGKFCEETEMFLFIKTKQALLGQIKHRLKTLHSYDVPEIIALPIIDGSEDYLRWMAESLS